MFKPKLSQPLSAACIAALMAFAAGRPALAFVQSPEKLVGGFLVPTGLVVYPICAVQVKEGNGDMVQRSFIDGNGAGALRSAKIQILMDTQLTGTQWTTNPELQDKLAVTLPLLPGEKLPRKLFEAKLPTVYKNTNPVAVGWTDDTGRCHVPRELDPKLYADPTKAIVLKPGSYRVLITFKYLPAGVGDAETANPELYKLW